MLARLVKATNLVVLILFCLVCSIALSAGIKTTGFVPAPPNFDVKAYILIDANSGYVVAEKNADQHLPPASLTKLASLYLIADALSAGRIRPTDMVVISKNAWQIDGSRMFVKVGSQVSVRDLVLGIVVASGNDATIAMSEYIAGTEEGFVSLMNQTAKNIGMNNTNFTDSNGLPDSKQYSTARDLATLARFWLNNFPQYYSWFKERWMLHNGIKQPNRNRLLWRDASVDGIKTGHTDDAGYCLIASAVRNGMRLISVVLGAKSDEVRTRCSEALLNYGFRFFETRKLFKANTSILTPRVWLGKEKTTALGLHDDMYVTLPVGEYAKLKAKAEVDKNLKAPITKGKAYGVLNITLDGKDIVSKSLLALQDNRRTNFILALYDYVLMLFQ